MTRFPHLAQRLFNCPIAILPEKAEVVMAALADRLGIAQMFRTNGTVVQLMAPELEPEQQAQDRPYDVLGGVAIIPVHGTLVQKLGCLHPFSGMTGYDGIRGCLAMALQDPEVRAIAFDIDSPGGEVAGCFDLVDAVYGARGQKPMHAILTENAFSAAYAIASAADRILVPRTGGTGSIGVIAMLVDFSRALDKEGVTVTVIQYGARKGDGNPYQPLPDEAMKRFQAQIDTMGELFVETVARNRGLPASAVRKTEAGTFMGGKGVSLGLADAVMAPDAAFDALRQQVS